MRIIFFDGVCSLCNGFISFLFKVGLPEGMKVASLQGKTAQDLLSEKQRVNLSSVIYLRDNRTFYESTAVILILSDIARPFLVMRLFLVLPGFFRDPVYRFIAKNRYHWFGKQETCRLPLPEERTFFLD